MKLPKPPKEVMGAVAWKALTKKELEMKKMRDSMKGMPGMENMQMFSNPNARPAADAEDEEGSGGSSWFERAAEIWATASKNFYGNMQNIARSSLLIQLINYPSYLTTIPPTNQLIQLTQLLVRPACVLTCKY
jgi:hypothetical protein